MVTQDIESLRTENEELRRLLEKHQWSGLTPVNSFGVCPECCASGAPRKVIALTAPSLPRWPTQTDR